MKGLSSVTMLIYPAIAMGLMSRYINMALAQEDSPLMELKAEIFPDPTMNPSLSPDYGFGWSIDYSGDTLIAGSFRVGIYDSETNSYASGGGSARIFVRGDPSSNVEWIQQGPPLVINDPDYAGDYVGYRVAIDGDTALVTATRGENGAARLVVFTRSGHTWTQEVIFSPGGNDPDDGLIPRVALEGDVVVYGKPFPFDNVGSGNAHGKVIVLMRTGTSWADETSTYTLEASDKKDGDYFGSDVAISAGRILVGADEREVWDTLSNSEALVQKGRAYLFTFDSTAWIEEHIFLPDSTLAHDRFHFGTFVDLDENIAIIGNNAQVHDCLSPIPVYGFTQNAGGSWDRTVLISSDYMGGNVCSFGRGVALRGSKALIEINGIQLILLEDWVQKDWLYPQGHTGNSDYNKNGNFLVLGTEEVFAGVDRGVDYTTETGSVHVYDNFSVRPPGPEEFIYTSSHYYPGGIVINYEVGHGHVVTGKLIQANCLDAVPDITFLKSEGSGMKNLTHDFLSFYYNYDPSSFSIGESVIFNENTWEIEICHIASLVESSPIVESEILLNLDVEIKPPGLVGGLFGDPHIVTFDQLKFDCQAAGVFTTLTSLEDPNFEIQERFTSVTSNACSQTSVSTGVVVKDGNKPVVQVSTPGYGKTSFREINECPVDIFVDGVASTLDGAEIGSNVLVKLPQNDIGAQVKIIHTDTFMTVDVKVEYSFTFGCFLMVQVYLPESFRAEETLLGLLGTPNGEVIDDWTSKSPAGTFTIIPPPASDEERLFSTAYEYCVTNWCQSSSNSLFTLRADENFDDINKCAAPYVDTVEAAVASLVHDPTINQELYDICTFYDDYSSGKKTFLDLSCVVDGLCGDTNDARNARNDRQDIESTHDQLLYYSDYPVHEDNPTQGITWDVKAQVMASTPDYSFGWSVDISGDIFIAGSYNSAEYDWNTDSYGPGVGSARVFKYNGQVDQPLWEQQGNPLIVSDIDDPDAEYVGYRVAIDDNVVLISATKGVGGVARLFVFELAGSGWEQTAMLHVDDNYLDDGRIPRVALEGNTAVYGRGYSGNGRVFIYQNNGSDWSNSIVQELTASDGATGDYFGADVAISGEIILIGANQRDMSIPTHGGLKRGKVYAFVMNDLGTWEEEHILYHPWGGQDHLQFGSAVALDGSDAMIGHDTNWAQVIVFKRDLGHWNFQQILSAPAESWDHWSMGKSIDINGGMALVGGESGEVTLFEKSRFGSWNVVQVFQSIGWYHSSRLGRNVALGSDVFLVGTDNGQFEEGSVQVFDTYTPDYTGPETIEFAYNGTYYPNYPKLDEIMFFFGFIVGYGHAVQSNIFEKDCVTPITDVSWNTSIYEGRKNFSTVQLGFEHVFDTASLEGSVIYNSESWDIELCVVGSLKESPEVKVEQVVSIFHAGSETPPGPEEMSFSGSWTNGNGISLNYYIGRDQDSETVLLHKDCETAISDTIVTGFNYTISSNSTYDYITFRYQLDPTTIRGSSVFNATSSTIEVCHEVRLTVNGDVFDRQVMTIVVPKEGTVAGLFGDPHIMTFDGLQFDCQAAGEFTTLTSLEDPNFKIQERFTSIQSSDASTCAQASVSTGVAFVDEGKPVIQISTPRSDKTSLNTINECPIDFYVDGTAYRLGATFDNPNFTVALGDPSTKIIIEHTDTFVSLDVAVHKSDSFGCYIMVQVALPGSFRSGETLLGLLGTPNGNKDDDWVAPDGTILDPPTSDLERIFSTAYNYCRQNWCAFDSTDSLFTYGAGESFEDIYQCDVDFSVEIETAFNAVIAEPSSNQALSEACDGNVACLVDGLCGDIMDAQVALVNEQVIFATKAEVKTAIFLPGEVEVKGVKSVTPDATTTTPTTTTTTTAKTTSTTTTTTTSLSTILDGYFGDSVHGLRLTTEYHIKMTISGTTCKIGDTKNDFNANQIETLEAALAVGFCDFNNFPDKSCSIRIEELTCNNNWRVLKDNLHMRALTADTNNNDLIFEFTVAVTGQCVNYDCSDGVDSTKAVGDVIEKYSADQVPALLAALKIADSSLFTFVTDTGLNIYYGDLLAPLLERYSVWYPKWETYENTCSNDGQYKPYMKKSNFVRGNLEECCNTYYSWAFDECMVLGGANQSSASNADYFYVDYYSNSCKQSCFETDRSDIKNCGGIAPDWMQTFKTAEDCCITKLFWLDHATCVTDSTKNNISEGEKGSKNWYVDWEMYKCVRDCVKGTGSNCGGLASNWDDEFDTPQTCCNTMLPWLDYSECVADD